MFVLFAASLESYADDGISARKTGRDNCQIGVFASHEASEDLWNMSVKSFSYVLDIIISNLSYVSLLFRQNFGINYQTFYGVGRF